MFEVLKGHTGSCQRRTCLKWEINGELSALDRKNLMQLLCQVDKQACIDDVGLELDAETEICLLYTSPSPRDATLSRMPSSA